MDEKFQVWKDQNKKFCEKANEYQQYVLYASDILIEDLSKFREQVNSFDSLYTEVGINKMINILASIRTHLRHTKG